MNMFRTISHVFVAAAVVVTGNAFGSEPSKNAEPSKARVAFNKGAGRGFRFVDQHKFTAVSMGYANLQFDKKDDAKKAGVETLGYVADRFENNRNYKELGARITPEEVIAHFGINYGTRKAARILNDRGISVKAAGKVCKAAINKVDYLPEEGMVRNIVNFAADNVVKPTAEAAAELVTQPEVITVAILSYLLPFIVNK